MLQIVLLFVTSSLVILIRGFPSDVIQKINGKPHVDDFENLVPKYDDFPNFDIPPSDLDNEVSKPVKKPNQAKSESDTRNISTLDEEDSTASVVEITSLSPITTLNTTVASNLRDDQGNLENSTIIPKNSVEVEANRLPRQEANETDDPEFASAEKQSQEDASNSSEEDENMITGLISAFLGGLSKPDGGVDVDAIVSLLGSLSTQNPDGTYDFQGLTDLLRGLFGGDGGSDVGAFVGGLLGAIIQGVANPPGARGTGILTGNIVNSLLPALSAPAPKDDDNDMKPTNKPPTLDVGGFLSGLLKTIFSGSSGLMYPAARNNTNTNYGAAKNTFARTIFGAVSSIFTASSRKNDWN